MIINIFLIDIDSNNYVTIEFTNKAKERYTEVYKYPEMLRLIELKKKYDDCKEHSLYHYGFSR